MKGFYFLIPLFLIIACNDDTPYFDGSVGVYDDSERIFWATIKTPDYQHVENAAISLDSVYPIGFDADNGGYYKEGISRLRYNSSHTIQVEMDDNDDIFGTAEIPSSFGLNVVDSVKVGDSLMIGWTHADSMQTPPDRWLMTVVEGHEYFSDTLYYLSIPKGYSEYKIPPGVLQLDIEIIMDAIKYGEISGARGGSVFVGVVRKTVTVRVVD
ncbi:hypothetical protein KAW48_10530 [candidate division WOR-3 bacterium]|nr:hypothetical protein [candidate division WOR-3 bacterium]